MGKRTYKPGDYIAQCDRCARIRYASELRLNWQNQFVCADTCWEERHPQDFVRAVPDNQTVPIARPRNVQTMGETTVKIAAVRNATAIDLTSVSGLADRDTIGIILNDGSAHWTFCDGTPSGDTVTLGSYLPGAAAVGNAVYLPSINSETFITATTATEL